MRLRLLSVKNFQENIGLSLTIFLLLMVKTSVFQFPPDAASVQLIGIANRWELRGIADSFDNVACQITVLLFSTLNNRLKAECTPLKNRVI